jgi:hypothetical protein
VSLLLTVGVSFLSGVIGALLVKHATSVDGLWKIFEAVFMLACAGVVAYCVVTWWMAPSYVISVWA